jgi:hypothetical protein
MGLEWELKYPMFSVRALPHLETLSDHTPLLLTTGNPSPPRGRQFKFELGWLQRDVFLDMVKNVWEKPVVGRSPIQRWKKNFALCGDSLVGG